MFGQSLGLQFKGEDMYKTKLGGLITLILYGLILTNLVEKTFSMVQKTDSTILSIKRKVDLRDAIHKHENLAKNGVDLAIVFNKYTYTDDDYEKETLNIPKSVGEIRMVSYSQQNDVESFQLVRRKSCEKNFGRYKDKLDVENLKKVMCYNLDQENVTIGGDFLGSNYSGLLL